MDASSRAAGDPEGGQRAGVSAIWGPGNGRVVALVLPEVNLLDLGGPVQVFDAS
jgi:hypothetical protein